MLSLTILIKGGGGINIELNNLLKEIDGNYGILISKNNNVVFEKYVGNSEDTKFRIFSCSKPINALAIFILAQENKLNLTDTINNFNINIPHCEKITINHLLNHTSGVYDFSSELYFKKNPNELFEKILKVNETEFINFDTTINEVNKNKPYFEPQENPFEVDLKNYNNTGYDLLGYIIYKVSRLQTDEFIKKNIFEPLEMLNASFQYKKDKNESIPYEQETKNIGIKEQQNWWCGNGQIICTLKDYDKFLFNYETLLNENFLKKYQKLYYFQKKNDDMLFSHEGGGDFSHSHLKETNYRSLSRSMMLKIFNSESNINIIVSENFKNKNGLFMNKYKNWNNIIDIIYKFLK